MKKLCLFFAVSIFVSCSKQATDDQIPVEISNLVTELEGGSCLCDPWVNEYTWLNKRVFVLSYRGPACNTVPQFWDRNGIIFTLPANYSGVDFFNDARYVRNIWYCE